MFQLILSILAIVLAVGLAAIAVSYIGDSFTGGKVKAEATTIINQASQIDAAMTLYNSKNYGQLDVGGRTSDTGLFDYLLAGEYLKETPEGNGGVWEIKCVDGANQAAFEASDDPADCGADGVALTLSGVSASQCNLINVLMKYQYTSDESAGTSGATTNHQNQTATEDGYVPTCTDEPNAPCCDGV